MTQMFDVDLAMVEGIEAACLYDTIERTCYNNRALGHCHRDGKYWADISMPSFTHFHPYLTEEQIKNLLEKLTEDGFIEKGNFKICGWDVYAIRKQA